MENSTHNLNVKYDFKEELLDISLKRIKIKGEEEELINIIILDENNEEWEFIGGFTKLIDIDPIFKKFNDFADIFDIIVCSFNDKNIKLDKIGDKFFANVKIQFIKNEANPKFSFAKKIDNNEDLTLQTVKSLKKEIEFLKSSYAKLPVISYVSCLQGNNSINGEFVLPRSQNVTFHLFIDYRLVYGTNSEEFLYITIKNEKVEKNAEKLLYKTWHGCHQGGSGYQDSKSINFMFIEKLSKGKNSITLRKQGNSYIYTLYLIAEL